MAKPSLKLSSYLYDLSDKKTQVQYNKRLSAKRTKILINRAERRRANEEIKQALTFV